MKSGLLLSCIIVAARKREADDCKQNEVGKKGGKAR